jgi:hypothetical protein
MEDLINRPASLDAFASEVHTLNEKWWLDLDTGLPKDRNLHEVQVLIISEWIECLEGERKDLMDDKLPEHRMAAVEMADAAIRILDLAGAHRLTLIDFYNDYATIPPDEDVYGGRAPIPDMIFHGCCTVTVPSRFDSEDQYASIMLADVERYCIARGYLNLWDIVREKLEYNKYREDHQIEHRRAAGGKKW